MEPLRNGQDVPRLAELLLRAAVPDADVSAGLLGDLEEDCADALGNVSGVRRTLWYWRAIVVLAGRFVAERPHRRGGAHRRSAMTGSLMGSGKGGGTMWEALGQDLRYAARKLVRTPGFTAITVLILGLGIGGTTALFSVVNSVLLKPLPFDEAERLVGVWLSSPRNGYDWLDQSPATYFTARDEAEAFEDIAMWDELDVTVAGPEGAERMQGMLVTDGIFDVLRVEAVLGRAFTAEDDSPGTPLTVILGHGYWERRFAADPAVIGRTLTVNGSVTEIVGVMPEGLRINRYAVDVYVPARFDRSQVTVGDFSYQAVGRLAPGATLERATEELVPLLAVAVERFPGGMSLDRVRAAGMEYRLRPWREELVGVFSTVLWFLFGAVAIVMLIACANVANLLMVRAESRRREVAIRSAIGAGRGHIVRGYLVESLALGVLGGLLGLVIAHLGVDVLLHFAPQEFPRVQEISLDGTAMAFASALSVMAALAFGTLPSMRLVSRDATGALKEAGRGAGGTPRRFGGGKLLVVSQVGLALVLLVGSGLMLRSFQALTAVEPGFSSPEDVLTFRVSLPTAEVPNPLDVAAFYENVTRELSASPGVVAVSGSNSLPMDMSYSDQSLHIEDFPTAEGETAPSARVKWIAGDYFETLRSPLLAGRSLTWEDTRERARVVVVNEAYAERHWGDARLALGRRVRYGNEDWHEIVGIARNAYDNGLDKAPARMVYWPLVVDGFWGADPWVPRWFAFAVRTSGPQPLSLVPTVRGVIERENARVAIFQIRTLDEIAAFSKLRTTFTLSLLVGATLVALLLAVVGIYGVIAYSVSTRTREIGVRLALGARIGDVRSMVLRSGLKLVIVGVVVGLGASLVLTRLMSTMLFGVQPTDVLTYGVAAAGIVVVALVASWLPACRATRVDPVEALGAE